MAFDGLSCPGMLALTLRQRLEETLTQELDAIAHSQSEAQSGMTHAESKAENDKDTRAIESSYLARGLAGRVAELRAALSTIQSWKIAAPPSPEPDQVLLGRVVELESEEEDLRTRVWLAPAGGGISLELEPDKVMVLSPQAPLARALLGKFVDDEVEVQSPSGTRTWVIRAVRA